MLLQLTYASRPFGYDSAMLTGILFDAGRCTVRDGITGALICRDDLSCSFRKGPKRRSRRNFARNAADDRRGEVRRPTCRPTRRPTCRLIADAGWMFGARALRNDPAASGVWSRAEVDAGAPDRASGGEVLAMVRRLSAMAPKP